VPAMKTTPLLCSGRTVSWSYQIDHLKVVMTTAMFVLSQRPNIFLHVVGNSGEYITVYDTELKK
jgi:hypothetical protein